MRYEIKHITEIINGKMFGHTMVEPKHLITDSRKIPFPGESIFFAISGSVRDAHQYIHDAWIKGVRCFVVQQKPELELYPETVFIQVANPLTALQALASFHRKQFSCDIVAITGSNGKTIVKEWLSTVLQQDKFVTRSPRSYNSQIGVPLSIWLLEERSEYGIFEAGISTVGEMEKLAMVISPVSGIFTNIGDAHDEGFSSKSEKINEKLKLFKQCKDIVYRSDYDELDKQIKIFALENHVQLFSWGLKKDSSVQLIAFSDDVKKGTQLTLNYKGKNHQVQIPMRGKIAIENAMTVIAFLLMKGYSFDVIQSRMQLLHALSMRLEIKKGIQNCTIINDSYSADLNSLRLALDLMVQQTQSEKKTVILSDFLQTGKKREELYQDICALLCTYKVQRLIGIGPDMQFMESIFMNAGIQTKTYRSTEEFLVSFHIGMFSGELILLKGARRFTFESILGKLEKRFHQTELSINLSAIGHNLAEYRKVLKPSTKLMVMVKAFSYGSGSYEIANLLQFHGVDYLAVAYADEGVDLRNSGILLPIMVLNPEPESFASIVENDLQPEIFSFSILDQFQTYLDSEGIDKYPIHIKLDTGMHRLGFEPVDIELLGQKIIQYGKMQVVSVFSHLVSSEDAKDDVFTLIQGNVFKNACETLKEKLGYDFIRHISNTAGIVRMPDLQMDMVRLGIGLYGVDTGNGSKLNLQQVSRLKTTIAQIRKIKAGDTVGYNRKGKVEKDSIIATIRIGYADGFPRSMSMGKGNVLIRNQFAPVIGSVCMDMTMVDVTSIPDVEEGDEVEIFGKSLSVSQLATWAGTIPYEIMTGISGRVKRVYYED